MSSSKEFSDTSSEGYLSDDSECLDFEEIACTMSFLTSRSIFGHIWPSGGLMRMIGENIDKTAFSFSAHKKRKDSIFLNFIFENEFLKDMNLPKENKLKS